MCVVCDLGITHCTVCKPPIKKSLFAIKVLSITITNIAKECLHYSIGSLQLLDWNGSLEWWNGTVVYNGGMGSKVTAQAYYHYLT